jgi:hypothetical protein
MRKAPISMSATCPPRGSPPGEFGTAAQAAIDRVAAGSIEVLLRKSVPDLTKTEVESEMTYRYVAQLPEVLSKEEWLAKYGEGKTTLQ